MNSSSGTPVRTPPHSPAVGVPVATPAPNEARLSSRLLSPETNEHVTVILNSTRDKSVELYTELDQQGAFSKFSEFNKELVRPLGRAQEIGLLAFWRDLVAAATLAPDEPKSGFTLWNAVAFYLAIAETIFSSLLSSDGLLVVGGKMGVAYAVAYAAHWIFNHSQRKSHLVGGLAFLTLAALAAAASALSHIVLVVTPLFRAAQAVSIGLATAHAFHIYRAATNAPRQLRAEEALAMLPPEAASAALSLLLRQLQPSQTRAPLVAHGQEGGGTWQEGGHATDARPTPLSVNTLTTEQLAEVQRQIREHPEILRSALDAKVGDAKVGDAKVGDAKVGDAKMGDAKATEQADAARGRWSSRRILRELV